VTGKCGHEIPVWWDGSRSTICEPCARKQGMPYTRNAFADLDERRQHVGFGPAVADYMKPRRRAA